MQPQRSYEQPCLKCRLGGVLRNVVYLLLASLCVACSSLPGGKPYETDIDRLEQALAGQPCPGNLDSWERRYRYRGHREAWVDDVDERTIQFDFYEAGVSGFVPGRKVVGVWEQMLYSGPGQIAFGSFNRETGAVSIDHCGPNYSGDPA
jgi:hypothetical protein